jgi:hypothetical protein
LGQWISGQHQGQPGVKTSIRQAEDMTAPTIKRATAK